MTATITVRMIPVVVPSSSSCDVPTSGGGDTLLTSCGSPFPLLPGAGEPDSSRWRRLGAGVRLLVIAARFLLPAVRLLRRSCGTLAGVSNACDILLFGHRLAGLPVPLGGQLSGLLAGGGVLLHLRLGSTCSSGCGLALVGCGLPHGCQLVLHFGLLCLGNSVLGGGSLCACISACCHCPLGGQ
jgi:hypothetical protein